MSVPMIARKDMKYRTRRLKAGDHFRVKSAREARFIAHLKQADRVDNENVKVALDDARDTVGLPPLSKESDDIRVWREKYQAKFDRRPFNGWDIPTLKAKIAEA